MKSDPQSPAELWYDDQVRVWYKRNPGRTFYIQQAEEFLKMENNSQYLKLAPLLPEKIEFFWNKPIFNLLGKVAYYGPRVHIATDNGREGITYTSKDYEKILGAVQIDYGIGVVRYISKSVGVSVKYYMVLEMVQEKQKEHPIDNYFGQY